MDFGIINIGIITVLCYFVAEILKNFVPKFNNKYLPLFCGALGGVLGVISMHVIDAFPATDYLSAVGIGIASGLAATGTNQIYKQLGINTSNVYNVTAADKYKEANKQPTTSTTNTTQYIYDTTQHVYTEPLDPWSNNTYETDNTTTTQNTYAVGDKDA